jgi:hypothetical protein
MDSFQIFAFVEMPLRIFFDTTLWVIFFFPIDLMIERCLFASGVVLHFQNVFQSQLSFSVILFFNI